MAEFMFTLREPLLLILLSVLVVIWFGYRKGRKLLAVRSVVIGVLIFLLAEPLMRYMKREDVKPILPVLVDVSRSVVIDGTEERSDSVRAFMKGIESKLGDRFRLECLQFWTELVPCRDSLEWTYEGTALGDVIEEVEKRFSPPAILLITDGVSNTGKHPLWVAKYADFPIFVFGFGPPSPKGDISLTRVRRNSIVYAGDEVPVEVWIKADGYKGERTRISIKEGENVIATEEIEFKEDVEERAIQAKLVPRSPGTKLYEASVTPLDGELNTENNFKAFALKVLKSKNKILYISSSPNWEHKFLTFMMETDPTLELHSYLPLSKDRSVTYPPGTHISFAKAELVDYDCYVIHDIPYTELPEGFSTLLPELVGDLGKSLLFIGGERMRGYEDSRIGEILPVFLEDRTRDKSFELQFTPEGKAHPVIESAGDHKGLPPLLGCNGVRGVKAGGTVWAVNSAVKTAQGELPCMIESTYGEGRVVVITCFPLWRWYFLLKGLGKEPTFYMQFLTNLTRWLSTRKDINPLIVELSEPIYQTFEEVEFAAELYDEGYKPIDGAFIRVGMDGHGELTLRPLGSGKYSGTISNLSPGEYQFTATAYLEGKEYSVTRGSVTIVEGSIESQEYGLATEILERIASLTGGAYYTFGDIDEVSTITFPKTEMARRRTLELIYWPGVYVALLALLIAEWAARRLRGL